MNIFLFYIQMFSCNIEIDMNSLPCLLNYYSALTILLAQVSMNYKSENYTKWTFYYTEVKKWRVLTEEAQVISLWTKQGPTIFYGF